jgi:carbon storage regulator
MLVLSRKQNESVIIDGRITVSVVRVEGDSVRLGVEAPREIPIHRKEVYEEIMASNRAAASSFRPGMAPLFRKKGDPEPVATSQSP